MQIKPDDERFPHYRMKLAVWGLLYEGKGRMEKQKNIILFMADELRSDYVGYSGSGKIETPNIDRIAKGCDFSCCQSSNPICAPARTSLITGRYPHQIGTLAMYGDLNVTIPTYMQVLQNHGYYTMGAGKLHYLATWASGTPRGKILNLVELKKEIKKFGFDELWESAGKQLMLRNFCDYGEYLEEKNLLEPYLDFVEESLEGEKGILHKEEATRPSILPEKDYIDMVTAEKSLEMLKNRPKDRPFYLFTSFCGPHMPFDPPEDWIKREVYEENDDFIEDVPLTVEQKKGLWKKRRNYRAMIRLIDVQIGRILDYLEEEGILEETVILFTADHGEMLGDHNRMGKAVPYKEACTVPLAVRHPDYIEGKKCSSPVSLVDVAATILDSAGIPVSELEGQKLAFSSQIPAKSLLPILRKETDHIREYSFSESGRNWQMLETKDWKYIFRCEESGPDDLVEELYHKKNDPDEQHNQAKEPEYARLLEWFRRRRSYELDHTLPIQTVWAPLHLEN